MKHAILYHRTNYFRIGSTHIFVNPTADNEIIFRRLSGQMNQTVHIFVSSKQYFTYPHKLKEHINLLPESFTVRLYIPKNNDMIKSAELLLMKTESDNIVIKTITSGLKMAFANSDDYIRITFIPSELYGVNDTKCKVKYVSMSKQIEKVLYVG